MKLFITLLAVIALLLSKHGAEASCKAWETYPIILDPDNLNNRLFMYNSTSPSSDDYFATKTLTFVSHNIQSGFSLSCVLNLNTQTPILSNAHYFTIQEVDINTTHCHCNQPETFADNTGKTTLFLRTINYAGGYYGHAAGSQYEILETRFYLYKHYSSELRGILAQRSQPPQLQGRDLWILSTHFQYDSLYVRTQTAIELVQYAKSISSEFPKAFIVSPGDYYSQFGDPDYAEITSYYKDAYYQLTWLHTNGSTYPSDYPVVRYDYMFYRAPDDLPVVPISYAVFRDQSSDHAPIRVDFSFPSLSNDTRVLPNPWTNFPSGTLGENRGVTSSTASVSSTASTSTSLSSSTASTSSTLGASTSSTSASSTSTASTSTASASSTASVSSTASSSISASVTTASTASAASLGSTASVASTTASTSASTSATTSSSASTSSASTSSTASASTASTSSSASTASASTASATSSASSASTTTTVAASTSSSTTTSTSSSEDDQSTCVATYSLVPRIGGSYEINGNTYQLVDIVITNIGICTITSVNVKVPEASGIVSSWNYNANSGDVNVYGIVVNQKFSGAGYIYLVSDSYDGTPTFSHSCLFCVSTPDLMTNKVRSPCGVNIESAVRRSTEFSLPSISNKLYQVYDLSVTNNGNTPVTSVTVAIVSEGNVTDTWGLTSNDQPHEYTIDFDSGDLTVGSTYASSGYAVKGGGILSPGNFAFFVSAEC